MRLSWISVQGLLSECLTAPNEVLNAKRHFVTLLSYCLYSPFDKHDKTRNTRRACAKKPRKFKRARCNPRRQGTGRWALSSRATCALWLTREMRVGQLQGYGATTVYLLALTRSGDRGVRTWRKVVGSDGHVRQARAPALTCELSLCMTDCSAKCLSYSIESSDCYKNAQTLYSVTEEWHLVVHCGHCGALMVS